MHKNSRIILVAMLVMALLIVGSVSVFAQNTQFSAYVSGIQVANLTDQAATITLKAYNENGSQNGSDLVDQIAGNSSATYFPIKNVDAGFSGSVVISSDKNVAAISNILESKLTAGASYVGRNAGATEVQLPLLNKANFGYTTWFSVQNASTDPAAVSVAYSDGTNANATIQPGAAKVFYQAAESHSGPVFAGTVTSDKPVVAAVIQESDKVMFAYTAFTGGATEPVFPLINANNFGYVTGLQIQNAGTTATDVTVSYTKSTAGSDCTETQTIQPGESNTFALAAFGAGSSNSDCVAGSTFVGSAAVTANSADQPLVGIGNQLSSTNGEAYGAFNPDDASNVVVMPLIMDRNFGYFTGFNVQHVGGPSSLVTCTFSDSTRTVSDTLSQGQALNDVQNNEFKVEYVGSARCEATESDAKIVAVVNQVNPSGGSDQFLVYEGVSP